MSIKNNQINLSNKIIKNYDKLLQANEENQPNQAHEIIIESLNKIKNYLIGASIGGTHTESGINFIKLQNQIELNATLVLLRWLSQTSNNNPFLSSTKDQLSPNPNQNDPLPHSQLVNQLSKTFTILQGLLHLHPPSQKLFSSEFNLKILLRFLPLALHSSKFSPIALPLLDLLLITFVESPLNAQLFESAGGLEILVQAMKQKGLKTELRVKVLETLWAWWIDEEEGADPDTPLIPPSMTSAHPSPKFNPAFPNLSSSGSIKQQVIALNNHQSSHTPHKHSIPGSYHNQMHNYTSETPSHNQTRGNSRIRPISLPPPSHSEQVPDITIANLSDGHESSMGRSPHRLPITPSTDSRKPIVKAKFNMNQMDSTHTPSPAMMVNSSSEGAKLNDAPSRQGTSSWDPASRLRTMLENTAGEFIPATPHHPRRVRPMTSTGHSNSPCREPHVLHKSHPTPQNQRILRNNSQHQMISESSSTKPSDESEDSDQLNISPHRLFAVRQRRTAIKQGNNTPQRLIRHKQSASLGSIQHQFQPDRTPKARAQSHLSSGDESKEGSGSEPAGQLGRARDRSVRPIGSPHPLSPRSATSSDHERSITPNDTRRSSLSRSSSRLEPGTPMAETSARKKITRVDEPSTVRPNRITAKMTPINGHDGKSNAGTRASSPSVHKEEGGLRGLGQERTPSTPHRSSRGKSTIAMPLTTMMTPTTTRRNGSNSNDNNNNQDNKIRTTVTGLNLTPNLSSVTAAHKRLITNRPLTPNKTLINQADLESIVNGTDSDVGASVALSPRKDPSSCSATPLISSHLHKKKTSSKKFITRIRSHHDHDDSDDDNDDDNEYEQVGLVDRVSSIVDHTVVVDNNKQKKKKKICIIPKDLINSPQQTILNHHPHNKNNNTNSSSKIKTGILEKYMSNSDELVRSFKEIGVGFQLLNHNHQS